MIADPGSKNRHSCINSRILIRAAESPRHNSDEILVTNKWSTAVTLRNQNDYFPFKIYWTPFVRSVKKKRNDNILDRHLCRHSVGYQRTASAPIFSYCRKFLCTPSSKLWAPWPRATDCLWHRPRLSVPIPSPWPCLPPGRSSCTSVLVLSVVF